MRPSPSMVETKAHVQPHHVEQLRRSCAEVIVPGDGTYDDARRLWNAIHDRRPAVIARPTTAEQVAAAVAFGREHGLEITVRSGGHSAAGLGGANDGLLVDMSAMRGVEVDPKTRAARANGGALLGELDVAAQAHGLVCPIGVIGHTGVAGLTLGGGIGRLQRHFGLTIDNRGRGRARHRRWPAGASDGGRRARALLGPPRRRLELRDRDGLRVPAPAVRARPPSGRAHLSRDAGTGGLEHVPRVRPACPGCPGHDLRDHPGGPGRGLRRRRGRQADRLPGLEPQRRGGRCRARHRGPARRPEAAHLDDRQPALSRGPDVPRPRLRLGQPFVHHEPLRQRHPSAGARGARRARRGGTGPLERHGDGARRSDRQGVRGGDGVHGSRGRVRPERRLGLDRSCRRRGEHGVVPPGDRGPRTRPDPRRLRERELRRRPRGIAPHLRRDEARPPGHAQARVGPRQRLPRESERGAGPGTTGRPD